MNDMAIVLGSKLNNSYFVFRVYDLQQGTVKVETKSLGCAGSKHLAVISPNNYRFVTAEANDSGENFIDFI